MTAEESQTGVQHAAAMGDALSLAINGKPHSQRIITYTAMTRDVPWADPPI
jgi:hypothetical protein